MCFFFAVPKEHEEKLFENTLGSTSTRKHDQEKKKKQAQPAKEKLEQENFSHLDAIKKSQEPVEDPKNQELNDEEDLKPVEKSIYIT